MTGNTGIAVSADSIVGLRDKVERLEAQVEILVSALMSEQAPRINYESALFQGLVERGIAP